MFGNIKDLLRGNYFSLTWDPAPQGTSPHLFRIKLIRLLPPKNLDLQEELAKNELFVKIK